MIRDSKIFVFLTFCIAISFLFLMAVSAGNIVLGALGCFCLSTYNMLRFVRRTPVFFVLFFIWLFSFDFTLVYYSGVPYYPFYKMEYINLVFLSMSVFQVLLLLVDSPKGYMTYDRVTLFSCNKTFYLLLTVFFIGTLSLKGENIFQSAKSYSAYQQNLAGASGLNEYLIMLAMVLLLFSRGKIETLIFGCCLLIYIYKSTVFGLRVQSLMVMIVFMMLFLKRDLKPLLTLLVSVSGFLLMLVFGFLKEGADIQAIGLGMFVDDRYGYAQSHQQGVLSSSTLIFNYQDNLADFQYLGVPGALLASTVQRRYVGDLIPWVYPSSYIQNFEYSPGGGIFTTQIVFLLGWPGLIVVCSLLVYLINSFVVVRYSYKPYQVVGFMVFVVFFPRWVSYDFFSFFCRTFIWILLFVFALKYFISNLRRQPLLMQKKNEI